MPSTKTAAISSTLISLDHSIVDGQKDHLCPKSEFSDKVSFDFFSFYLPHMLINKVKLVQRLYRLQITLHQKHTHFLYVCVGHFL